VLAVADHGESQDEHGYVFNHGGLLHEPALHVPLIVRWPGRTEPGTRVEELVGTRAIASTLLRACGLDPSTELFVGADAVQAFTPGQQNRRGSDTTADSALRQPKVALRFPGGKLVVSKGRSAWFDLEVDPGELAPRAVPEPHQAKASDLARFLEAKVPPTSDAEAHRLRALGYVE
jgi:arylsulfatase A-like enzyme